MGSHFFDRFAGRLGRHGNGPGRRQGHGYSDMSSPRPDEARQPVTRIVVCPRCWADNEPDSRFCNACGNPLNQTGPVCAGCGDVLKPGVKFCSSCGRAVG